ncbi:MAG: hypothetical protein U1F71_14250 [Verrucomicrobiaceae bacterium]
MYTDSGFVWSKALEDFCRQNDGREMWYPHFRTGDSVLARFCVTELILVGRKHGQHEIVSKWLGEEFAPVGDCSDGNIELLLTVSGRLIGFADYMMLAWDNPNCASTWQQDLIHLLRGMEPRTLGIIE